MTHILKFERSSAVDRPSMQTSSAQATQLRAAACEGTDAALALLLPHARAIKSSRRGMLSISVEVAGVDACDSSLWDTIMNLNDDLPYLVCI